VGLDRSLSGHQGHIPADLEMSLAPTPAAPAHARAALSDWLAAHSRDAALAEIALLLVSELVTNSVRHALIRTDERLRLTGRVRAERLRLAVWDAGTEGLVHRRARVGEDETGGFGLDLVARLSSAWGVERDAHGTTVWLDLALVRRAH
jgi:anti-sigma regulatory factor (Ser/Thr protein kinase)